MKGIPPASTVKAFILKPGIFIILFLQLLVSYVQAQPVQLPNGTLTTQEFIDLLESNLTFEKLIPFDPENPDLNERLTVEVFIVRNSGGFIDFKLSDLIPSIDILNSYFDKIGVEFLQGNITYVPEYMYSTITHRDSTKELEIKYAVENKINLFLVDSIYLTGVNCFGYTFYPNEPKRNFIFLRKDHILNNYLVTLMGNFFGLLPTHETLGGSEFVSGSNCASTGDYICDTYADPGLLENVNDTCLYQGAMIDPEGKFYIPSVANIMSESSDSCKCIFTNEQYRRMKYHLLTLRKNLR